MDLRSHLHDVVAVVGPIGPGTVVHRARPGAIVAEPRPGSVGPPPACPAGDDTAAQLAEERDAEQAEARQLFGSGTVPSYHRPTVARRGTGWFRIQGAVAGHKGASPCTDCWPAA